MVDSVGTAIATSIAIGAANAGIRSGVGTAGAVASVAAIGASRNEAAGVAFGSAAASGSSFIQGILQAAGTALAQSTASAQSVFNTPSTQRLINFYNMNDYHSLTNPGGFRNRGHRYNFIPFLKDVGTIQQSRRAPVAMPVARTIQFHTEGKWFVRLNIAKLGSGAAGLISVVNLNKEHVLGSGADSFAHYQDGIFKVANVTIANAVSWAQENIQHDLAFDFDIKKVWARNPPGGWLGDILSNQNPATGVGGVSLASLTTPPWCFAIGFGDVLVIDQEVTADLTGTLNVPLGFLPWDIAEDAFDPAHTATGLILSDGNLMISS